MPDLKWVRTWPEEQPPKDDWIMRGPGQDQFARVCIGHMSADPNTPWYWTVSRGRQIGSGNEATRLEAMAAARRCWDEHAAWDELRQIVRGDGGQSRDR